MLKFIYNSEIFMRSLDFARDDVLGDSLCKVL